jgi:recombination protein RecT
MNQITTQAQAERRVSPVEAYTAQVIGDEITSAELFRALPSHIPPERFKRNLINALMQNPDMLKYDPRLVYREVSKAAALGLLLDPQLGEAYIVPVWNAKAGRPEPQLRVGYRGIIKLGRQSGEITAIYAHEVHENDEIDCDLGVDKRLVHKPLLFGDRGRVVGYYAVAKFKDGEADFEPMTLDQIHAIRDKSDGWRAFKAGKIKSTPWSTDEGEMAKKTVIKRLCKRIPQSPDLATALSLENDANPIEPTRIINLNAGRPLASQTRAIESRLDQFAAAGDQSPQHQPAEDAHPQSADEPEAFTAPAEADGAPASSENSATDPGTEDDAGAPLPEKIVVAMEMGRGARRSGLPRETPRTLQYKSKQDEAAAFRRGWDEENLEIQAEDGGTV